VKITPASHKDCRLASLVGQPVFSSFRIDSTRKSAQMMSCLVAMDSRSGFLLSLIPPCFVLVSYDGLAIAFLDLASIAVVAFFLVVRTN